MALSRLTAVTGMLVLCAKANAGDCFQHALGRPVHVAREESLDAGLWHLITSRSEKEVYGLYKDSKGGLLTRRLEHLVLETVEGQKVDALGEILKARKAAVRGEGGVLSLGEGRSDFIASLLELRKKYIRAMGQPHSSDHIRHIQAVDVSYPAHDAHGTVTDARLPLEARVAHKEVYDPGVVPLIKTYPLNYHGQRFQELTLKDDLGNDQKFSLIISNHSLGWVLQVIPANEMRPLLSRVLGHLAPGGKLVMVPTPKGANARAYDTLLAQLKADGEVLDYTPRNDTSSVQVILK